MGEIDTDVETSFASPDKGHEASMVLWAEVKALFKGGCPNGHEDVEGEGHGNSDDHHSECTAGLDSLEDFFREEGVSWFDGCGVGNFGRFGDEEDHQAGGNYEGGRGDYAGLEGSDDGATEKGTDHEGETDGHAELADHASCVRRGGEKRRVSNIVKARGVETSCSVVPLVSSGRPCSLQRSAKRALVTEKFCWKREPGIIAR